MYIYESHNRRSGRTTKMINHMIDCIEDGQPMVIVIGLNNSNIKHHLIPMIIKELNNRNINITRRYEDQLYIDEQVIKFISCQCGNLFEKIQGIVPCWFVDHACIDYIDDMTLKYLIHKECSFSKYTVG